MWQRASFVAIAVCVTASAILAADLQPADAAQAAKYSESRRGISILVIQNGRPVFEHYANGGAEDQKWPIFSGTKSFWGVAALAASREGLFRLDDPVADTITEWKSDPRKSTITIRQLLNFTDGLEGASRLHRESIRDRNAMAIRLPLVASPGTSFTYGPSHLQVFCELLRRKLNGRSPFAYLKKRVLDPLGLGALEHKEDSRGNPLLASGFKLTAREWARFGELILAHGRDVVPRDVLQAAFQGSGVNPAYGLTFWLNSEAARPDARELDIEDMLDLRWDRANWQRACICRDAPPDMVVALGSGYQRLFVIPSMNALIVRQGSNAKFSDAKFLRLVLGRAERD
jgi:CubicO group peptidase (beta-lactamase class C family)